MNLTTNFKKISSVLTKKYSLSAIYSALLSNWAKNNDINLSDLASLEEIEPFFASTPKECEEIATTFSTKVFIKSLKDLENCFEVLLSGDQVKTTGIVLTPDFIIDNLINEGLSKISKSNSSVTICDPACGYGGFLIRAALILKDRYGLDFETSLTHNIYGFDIDKQTLSITKLFLRLFLLSKGVKTKLNFNLFNVDTLLSPTSKILSEARILKGFDLIVTNPPYVKIQNLSLSYRENLSANYPNFTKGSYATAPLFLVACHGLLNKTGCIAVITQNNLFTSLSGEPVRAYLKEHQCISRIVDFCHNKIFENASAYTCLIFLSNASLNTFEYGRLDGHVDALSLSKCVLSQYSHANLQTKKWRLAQNNHFENLKRIENIGNSLGDLFKIRVGFATLKDSVFLVEEENNRVFGYLPDSKAVEIEKESTQPAIKIAEFNDQDSLQLNRRRIIFPYLKHKKGFVPFTESEFKSKFPNCYDYLVCWQDMLASRSKGKINLTPWFAWGRAQSMSAPGPKLLTKTFNSKPNFLLDKTDSLFCNGYALFPSDQSKIPLIILQKILNSSLMAYYVKLTSFQIEGNFQCYQKNFIEKFGIFNFDEADISILEKTDQLGTNRFLADKYGVSLKEIKEIISYI